MAESVHGRLVDSDGSVVCKIIHMAECSEMCNVHIHVVDHC